MLGTTDGTLPNLIADAVLVVLVAVNATAGWRTGTLRRLLALAGVYVGVLAAYYTGNGFASMVRKGDIVANAWSFIAVLCVVVLIMEVLGHLFAERLTRLAALAFDRVAGLILGAVAGLFQALVLFMVALAVGAAPPAPNNAIPVNRDAAGQAVRGALLSSQAIRAEPLVRRAFAPVLGTDLTTHLEEGTGAGRA